MQWPRIKGKGLFITLFRLRHNNDNNNDNNSKGLLSPGWLRKTSADTYKKSQWHTVNRASGNPSPAPSFHVAELFGTNRRRGER